MSGVRGNIARRGLKIAPFSLEQMDLSAARRLRLDGDLHLTIRPAALESAAAVP